MNSQLQTPVLAAHYRVMPGTQQLQEQQQQQQEAQPQVYPVHSTDGRTFAGFSFNAGFGSGAEMIFYEFAGMPMPPLCASWCGVPPACSHVWSNCVGAASRATSIRVWLVF